MGWRLRAARSSFVAAILAVCEIGSALPAVAQQEPGCWVTRDGPMILGNTASYFDGPSTQTWLATLARADGAAMQRLAGVYYGETPAPEIGMINYQYRSYQANGLFEYRDRTCSSTGCSENQGHGRWAAYPNGRGGYFVMITWSDLLRTNACLGSEAYPDGGDLVFAGGNRWKRVQ